MININMQLHSHFVFPIEGVQFGYLYLRKNGCSTFRNLMEMSARENDLGSSHSVFKMPSLSAFSSSRYRLAILRDPVERIVSCWNNKFIQQYGHKDMMQNFSQLCSIPEENITFVEYVTNYVRLAGSTKMDVHLLPQSMYMFPLNLYTNIYFLSELNSEIRKIIPVKVFAKVFGQLRNNTSQFLASPTTSDIASMPVAVLRKKFEKTNTIPNFRDIIDENMLEIIQDVYSEDYKLIEAVSADRMSDFGEREDQVFCDYMQFIEAEKMPDSIGEDVLLLEKEFAHLMRNQPGFVRNLEFYLSWMKKHNPNLESRIKERLHIRVF